MAQRRAERKSGATGCIIVDLVGLIMLAVAACAVLWLLFTNIFEVDGIGVAVTRPTPVPSTELELRVGYSPEKETLFLDLVNAFNAQNLAAQDGTPLHVHAVPMEPNAMITAALAVLIMARLFGLKKGALV